MQHDQSEKHPPDIEPSQWMTKAELAAVRGIALESAERLYRRQGWRRMPGNDGRVRVLVPPDWLEPRSGNPPDEVEGDAERPPDEAMSGFGNPPDNAPDPEDISRQIMVLQTAIEALQQVRDEATERAKAAEALADHALGLLADAQVGRDRAEAALAGERTRADSLRDRLETAEQGRRLAEEAAEVLRQAEARWQASGLWQRLLAAWKGDKQ